MRKFFLAMLLLISSVVAMAQSAANYVFSTNTTGSLALDMNGNAIDMSTGTTTLIDAGLSGASSVQNPIGFDFWFLGGRQTLFNATGNGLISFNAVIASTASNIASSSGARLAPFNIGTAAANMATSSTGKVHYKTQGAAPNRVLIVEWLNMSINATSTTADATFQARMYETTGVVEFVYGAMNAVTGGPFTVARAGISSNTTVNTYHTIDIANNISYTTNLFNNTINNGVITNLNSATNGVRRVYRYTPTIPSAPTGLNATSVSQTGLTLNWTDNTTDETNFAIYRSDDGGTSYNFITTATVNSITAAQTFLAPSTSYMYRVFTVREVLSTAASVTQATMAGGNIVSTSSGGLWSSASTWVGGVVPQNFDNVTIADGATVTISNTSNVCFNLTVGQGTSGILEFGSGGGGGLVANGNVTIAAGGTFTAGTGGLFTHTLGIGGTSAASRNGNLVNNGTFDMSTANGVTTTFFGNLNGSISGIGATTDFYVLIANKGANQTDATLDVTIPITIAAPTSSTVPRLTITTGTLKISSATVATPYFGSQTICATTGRLWLNNANASLQCVGTGVSATGAGSPTINGELRIDNGLFGYGQGNNTLAVGSSGTLRLNGGILNMFGAVSLPSNISTQLIMSGGSINVDAQNVTSLATGTAIFSIGASTTINLTGGTITIVDPHSAGGGTAWSYTAGSAKLITSGFTLNIGDGISTATGGTLSNTSGFGISGTAIGLNMVINNRTDAFTSRMVRLVGINTVTNLTLSANSYLFTGSATTGSTMIVRGNVVNNGTLAGSEPDGTQAIGTLYFNGQAGSGTQTLSGTGTFRNNGTVTIENYGNGVVFSNTNSYKANRVNLFTGSLNVGANFTLGNSSATALESPTLQFGSGSATLAVGTFTVFPTLDETELPRSLIYAEALGAHTMGNGNEIGTGMQTVHLLSLSDIDGLTISNNRSITVGSNLANGTLQMSLGGGNINLSGGTLTLGANATFPGTMSYTQGTIQNGSFKRWYPTTGLTTAQGLTTIGFYPMSTTNSNSNRNTWVYFSNSAALSVGGTITVTHSNPGGGLVTIPSFVDGSVNVDRRSSDSWSIVPGDGITLGAFTASLSVSAANMAVVTTLADCRLINATSAVATSVNASGTVASPILNRNGMSISDLNNTFYFGAAASNVASIYTSITSGNWGDNGTWDIAGAPSASDNVIISAGHTVTVAGATTVGNNLTITASGTLTANANNLALTNNLTNNGNVNIGNTGTIVLGNSGGGAKSFNINSGGTLNVTGGTLNINGSVLFANGSNFSQSGGDINIDGNDGTSGNSVPITLDLFGIGTSAVNYSSGTINVTGGNITIVDPHFAGTATATAGAAFAFRAATNRGFGTAHTITFGGASGTNSSTSAVAFLADCFVNSSQIVLGNVIVNGGNYARRLVTNAISGTGGLTLGGNLTINAGSEIVDSTGAAQGIAIAGNLINNGILTQINTSGLRMQGFNSLFNTIPNNQSQSISGAGIFRNLVTSPTANFTAVSVNNTHLSGVTFGTGILIPSVSGAVTITDGRVNADGITFNSTSAQAVALTALTSSINVQNLTLNTTNTVTLSGLGFLNVTGAYTKTAGTLAAGGKLVLKSTAAGTARLNALTAGSITGNVVVERFIPALTPVNTTARKYRFFAAPIVSQSINAGLQQRIHITGVAGTCGTQNASGIDFTTNGNTSMFDYDATRTVKWGTGITNTLTTNLTAGTGYRVLVRGSRSRGCTLLDGTATVQDTVTLYTVGVLAQGDISATLKGDGSAYTLIGNPYASPIDWNNATWSALRTANNITGTYYTYHPASAAGTYTTYDGTNLVNGQGLSNGNIIASGQAFFVKKSTVGSATVSNFFQESYKSATAQPGAFRTNGASQVAALRVGMKLAADTSHLDEAIIAFATNSDVTKAYNEAYDSKTISEGAQTIAAMKENEACAIQRRPSNYLADTVALKVNSNTNGSYNLYFSDYADITADIFIRDKFTNTIQDVKANNYYSFSTTSNPASQGVDRFEVIFRTASTLPITFTSINAKNKGVDEVAVTWAIPYEQNVQQYEVERSNNGTSFTQRGIVASKGNSNSNVNYAFDDAQRLAGVSYYRVKAIAKSGEFKYSPVVTVKSGKDVFAVSIYPNPVKEEATLVVQNGASNYSISVITLDGKQVISQPKVAAQNNVIKLNVSNLAAGVYMLQVVTNDGNSITQKLIKE